MHFIHVKIYFIHIEIEIQNHNTVDNAPIDPTTMNVMTNDLSVSNATGEVCRL